MLREAETLFLGSFVNKIDAKGRLATPARFRRVLDAEKSSTIYVIPSPDEPCLDAGGPAYIERLMASIAALPPFQPERRLLQKRIAGRTMSLSMDGEGRIVLPQEMREFAHLGGDAAFCGQGDHFQIWNPRALEAATGDDAAVAEARLLLSNPAANGGLA
ncbi:MAG: division/cell wall cluster transcriptional repressor MraZ [Pseudomonadota bacterium]